MNRRSFIKNSLGAAVLAAMPSVTFARPKLKGVPKVTFYGSTQQVSGSCHLFENSKGLFLVDCGLFMSDITDGKKENTAFPFDPKDVKAILLTHAHVDHNGRLPLLYEKGFRGKIYCTDASRDMTHYMLESSANITPEDEAPLYSQKSIAPTIGLMEAVPYNTKFEREGMTLRYTDAGHLLGSAMVEVWIDGVKVLFSGDMGPDYSPILCKPTQHFGADAVLVESTYGPVAKDTVTYEEFGKKINGVIEKGGSVLIPAFALQKTQTLIYIINKLMDDRVINPKTPLYSDSSTAQHMTQIFNRYKEYYDPEAKKYAESGKNKEGLFYRHKYREIKPDDSLATHGKEPAIYISTSGMLDHAMSAKHLQKMAGNEKDAVFIVGYQAPDSVGKKLLSGEKKLDIPIETRQDKGGFKRELKSTEIKLTVEKVSGFSSHARGGQILDWLHNFESVGPVYVVHGDKPKSTGLAEVMKKMDIKATAPIRNDTFEIRKDERVKPGAVPPLPNKIDEGSPVDK